MGRRAVMIKSMYQGQYAPAVAVALIDTTHPSQVGATPVREGIAVSGRL